MCIYVWFNLIIRKCKSGLPGFMLQQSASFFTLKILNSDSYGGVQKRDQEDKSKEFFF